MTERATLRVRAATLADAPGLAAVHFDSWEGAYRGLVPDAWLDARPVAVRLGHWREWLAAADGPRTFAAVDEQTIVGLCAVRTPSPDEDADPSTAQIGALYVAPSHWRRGAGRALVDTAVAWLRLDGGWSTLTLWVFDANERARRFYETVGFVDDGGRFAHPDGPPEIRLRRALARRHPGDFRFAPGAGAP